MSSASGTSGSGSLRRVICPQPRFMPCTEEQVEERSRLLSKMDALYREACARLAVEATLAMPARLLDAGVCVGLLDPVSNIMANTLFTTDLFRPDPHLDLDETKLAEMGNRSLDGLVAFLVYFFPYLAGWDALRYLLVADADLLVASRLIVADRGMMGFSVTSPASVQTFQGALRLAAQVAKHPQPQHLVSVWMSLSSPLQLVHGILSAMQNKATTQGIYFIRIERLLVRGQGSLPDLGKAWDLAASRPPYSSSIASMPYQATRSLRMALLDTIRGFYLRALARLPRHELRTRYHRSMLKAGYCYGPLDPVSNIIVNTIWYDVMSLAAQCPVLDMIGPNSLNRLESRSFYGLASFLQTRYHNLSEHQVVQCLVASCAHLSLADPNFDAATTGVAHLPVADLNLSAAAMEEAEQQRQQCRTSTPGLYDAVRKVEQQSPCTSAEEAYEAAATAAWHPNPEAHAVFLSKTKAMLQGPVFLLLQNGDKLTSENVQFITNLLLLSSQQQPIPEQITKKNLYPVIAGKRRSEAQQRRISTKVKAALDKHLLRDGEPIYELHIICGANEFVGSPEYCDDKDDDLSFAPCKFRYTHVNFLVTQKDSPSADGHPLLFFAEFDNEECEPLLCCRVDVPTPFAEHVRCLYCEGEGTKIVHPASEKFHGREREFEDAICGGRNDDLICENEYAVQSLCGVEEDFMYVDMKCIS